MATRVARQEPLELACWMVVADARHRPVDIGGGSAGALMAVVFGG